jgi:hypothetical protein
MDAGDVIFVGKIVAIDKMAKPESGAFLSPVSANFIVDERFRAAGLLGNEMVIHAGAGGGGCGYPFAVGTSYYS